MSTRTTGALTLTLAAALLAAGCSTSTGPDPPDDDPLEYKPRTNPENVLYNLRKAYGNMDADAYLDCLAEDYVFYLNPDDLAGNPTLPGYWDKTAETTIHENMFAGGGNVDSVALAMTHVSTACDDCGTPDPMDNLWTYVEDIDLRVELPPDLTLHADAPAEFLFRVDPDSIGPNGEVLWEIWKQWDLNARGPGGRSGDREDSSWGRIKWIYS